jgi:hypothetical protein
MLTLYSHTEDSVRYADPVLSHTVHSVRHVDTVLWYSWQCSSRWRCTLIQWTVSIMLTLYSHTEDSVRHANPVLSHTMDSVRYVDTVLWYSWQCPSCWHCTLIQWAVSVMLTLYSLIQWTVSVMLTLYSHTVDSVRHVDAVLSHTVDSVRYVDTVLSYMDSVRHVDAVPSHTWTVSVMLTLCYWM